LNQENNEVLFFKVTQVIMNLFQDLTKNISLRISKGYQ